MPKERILVTVKTYPTLSRSYGETVCTAGIREDGSWVRIYPVPFRRLGETEQYSKYDWLECDLIKNTGDPRPESFRPVDVSQFSPVDHIDTRDDWRERRRLILQTATVYKRMQPLIADANNNILSLAVFKPAKVLDFVWEEDDREWDKSKVDEMRSRAKQVEMFEEDAWRQTFKLIRKLPYKFSYRFEDVDGKTRELQVLDWETGQLFWNCLRDSGGNEDTALSKVKERYYYEYLDKDLHYYLGTTQQYHGWATNPWVIIGVFPIPHEKQLALL